MSILDEHPDTPPTLTLAQAAQALGVHYMTAYRYVRTSRLPAHYDGHQWWVERAALDQMRSGAQPGRRGRLTTHIGRDYAADLLMAATGGDEATAWQVTQDALTAGMTPERIYLEVLAPALHEVGLRWTEGRASITDEHLTTAIVQRLIGRLGPMFHRRGRRRGVIVLGAIGGDPHALATALLADPLRGRGFTVIDLGANAPVESFVDGVRSQFGGRRLTGIGLVVSLSQSTDTLTDLCSGLRAALAEAGEQSPPLLLGGVGTTAEQAASSGFDGHSDSYASALEWFEQTAAARA